MVSLSFRSKLVVAMLALVLLGTGAALYSSGRSFQATQRRSYEVLFEVLTQSAAELQTARLKNAKAHSQEFARSVRLRLLLLRYFRAIENGDDEDAGAATALLYKTAEDELRLLLNENEGSERSAAARFFRFMDPNAQVLDPPAGIDGGLVHAAGREYLQSRLGPIGLALPEATDDEVGFLAPPRQDGTPELIEVVVTRIIDPRSDEFLGSLVIGFTVPEEMALRDSRVATGLAVEGELFSSTLKPESRKALLDQLDLRVKEGAASGSDFIAELGASRCRVFHAVVRTGANFPRAIRTAAYSLSDEQEAQQTLRSELIGFGAASVAGALAVGLFLSHGLTASIRDLVAGTVQIRKGNFAVQVPVRSRDELGLLATSFNDMAQGLALKEKYRSILNVVADPQIAEELLRGGVALGGESRQVSVLFCDIRGFTALTQNMHPDEVIRMLNEHFTPLTRVVHEHHGVVDKFVGDLIMAVFGAPRSYGNDAQLATQCALAMLRSRSALNATSRYTIEVGIGIASGSVVAGCMGSNDRLEYTVLGERVNLASRLCSKAGRMEIVIDQTTRDAVGETLATSPLEPLILKGFSEPVSAFRLVG